jgi:hypothetical protein
MTIAPVLLLIGLTMPVQVTQGRTPSPVEALTQARTSYNDGRLADALAWLAHARGQAAVVDSAELVFARVSLERFRRDGDVADVATARQALLAVNPARLTPVEAREFRLATGELLFVDEQFGAAAEVFEVALGSVADEHRERVFEWWASSLDRYAQLAPDGERQRRYSRLLTGVDRETRVTGIAYWRAVALRGIDDLDRAWAVAIAGWIEAPATAGPERSAALRSDIDRLMREAIIPERARRAAVPADPEALRVALDAEWSAIKKRWSLSGFSAQ